MNRLVTAVLLFTSFSIGCDVGPPDPGMIYEFDSVSLGVTEPHPLPWEKWRVSDNLTGI